jgi:hypothetical protein
MPRKDYCQLIHRDLYLKVVYTNNIFTNKCNKNMEDTNLKQEPMHVKSTTTPSSFFEKYLYFSLGISLILGSILYLIGSLILTYRYQNIVSLALLELKNNFFIVLIFILVLVLLASGIILLIAHRKNTLRRAIVALLITVLGIQIILAGLSPIIIASTFTNIAPDLNEYELTEFEAEIERMLAENTQTADNEYELPEFETEIERMLAENTQTADDARITYNEKITSFANKYNATPVFISDTFDSTTTGDLVTLAVYIDKYDSNTQKIQISNLIGLRTYEEFGEEFDSHPSSMFQGVVQLNNLQGQQMSKFFERYDEMWDELLNVDVYPEEFILVLQIDNTSAPLDYYLPFTFTATLLDFDHPLLEEF